MSEQKTIETANKKKKLSPVGIVLLTVTAIILILAIFIGAIIGLVFHLLDAQKDSPEYKVAYKYLITSDAFEDLDADETDVWLNQFSTQTYFINGRHTRTSTMGFRVKDKHFTVVCHIEDGQWVVCEECTEFD